MAKSRRKVIEEMVLAAMPNIERAFLNSIQMVRSDALIGDIIDRLRRGDIDGAVDAVQLDSAAFAAYQATVDATFLGAGQTFTQALPKRSSVTGDRMVVRFDGRNARAERILQELAGQQITHIVEDQLTVIRTHLTEGMVAGRNPRSVALELIGRVNPRTGRREGGIIGLTEPMERYVRRARRELETGQYGAYKDRTRRDRSLDRLISKAEKEGRPLAAEEIDRMTGRYSDRLLQLRAENIGRTEAMAAIQASQDEALRQAVDKGLVAKQDVKRIWRTASDTRVRHTHASMAGQEVGLDEPFLSPSGAQLRYPGDPEAPADEVINCRCVVENRIDYLGALKREEGGAGLMPAPVVVPPAAQRQDIKGNLAATASSWFDMQKLSPEQRAALMEYQAGFVSSEMGGYSNLQTYLREGRLKYGLDRDDWQVDMQQMIQNLDAGIESSTLSKPTTVYRGVGDLNPLLGRGSLAVGDTFTDPGYMSTSTSSRVEKFTEPPGLSKSQLARMAPARFEIELEAGQHAFPIDVIEAIGESEVVLPRGTSMEVIGVRGGRVPTYVLRPTLRKT